MNIKFQMTIWPFPLRKTTSDTSVEYNNMNDCKQGGRHTKHFCIITEKKAQHSLRRCICGNQNR